MIDDGQFGQAVVLTQFNWARGYSEGAEFKIKYHQRQLQRLRQFRLQHHQGDRTGVQPVSVRRRRIRLSGYHYHYTDDMQRMTGSAGASYRWDGTLFTTNMNYGSGLRFGTSTSIQPAYAVFNAGIAHDFRGPGRQAGDGAV